MHGDRGATPPQWFVSEWLTFQAILLSPDVPSWGIKLIVPAVGAMLALSAALAAACFVKAFGVGFLVVRAHRRRWQRRTRTVVAGRHVALAALCLVAGILRASSSMDEHPSCKASSAPARPRNRHRVVVDHSCRRAETDTGYWSSPSSQLDTGRGGGHPSFRFARRAPWPGMGSAASRTRARPLNTPPTVLPSRYGAWFGEVVLLARERVDTPVPGDAWPAD